MKSSDQVWFRCSGTAKVWVAQAGTRFFRFSNNQSSCHNPSEAACLPVGVVAAQQAHPWFPWPGSEKHND
jgi:hypothetical protein